MNNICQCCGEEFKAKGARKKYCNKCEENIKTLEV
jgi:tRNA(Ile2) C34 agmatinyltransferase TiaS